MSDDQDRMAPEQSASEVQQAEPALRFVSQQVTLDRAEVVAALGEAVLAKATELSRFGEPRLRDLVVDATIGEGDAVDIVGVIATIEAPLDPAVLALLSTSVQPARHGPDDSPDDQPDG